MSDIHCVISTPGNPDPLVFHAPQSFFDCLQQRIATGNKKKRLPNSTTGFVRKDALPLGTFTKYTWQITNILHVKQIFDTSEVNIALILLSTHITNKMKSSSLSGPTFFENIIFNLIDFNCKQTWFMVMITCSLVLRKEI